MSDRPLATPVPTPDTPAALAWLKTWHHEPPWVIVEIDPLEAVRRPPAHIFYEIEKAEAYLEKKNGITNLYFVPNRLEPEARVTTTPTKEDIAEITCLQVDLDLPKTGPYIAQTQPNIDRLLTQIEGLYPPPTVTIFSGGGLQAYWLFDTPLPAAEYRDKVEEAGKAIASELGSDAVQNINRLMRLPGTINLGNPKKNQAGRQPMLARVLRADWGRTWSIFTDQVPRFIAKEEEDAPWVGEDEEDEGGENDEDKERRSSSFSPRFATSRFHELTAQWQRKVVTGNAKDYGGDRSSLIMGFIATVVRKGWSEDDIVAVLIDRKYRISDHIYAQGANPESTVRRQVGRIRRRIATNWDMKSDGSIDTASPRNIGRALEEMNFKLSYDAFTNKTWVNGRGPATELSDPMTSELRVQIFDKYNFLPRADVLMDVTTVKARRSTYHPVLNYLSKVEPTWDGTPRLESWLVNLAGARDDPYTRAVSRLILIAAVYRVRNPGWKFDEMLVLSSKQGTGKSTAIRTLCPNREWFTDSFKLSDDHKKILEQITGKWLVECSELDGLRKAEIELVKSTLGREVDRARLAWGRRAVDVPRQCVFFGTTNSVAFLTDKENRRFWPVPIKDNIDLPGLEQIRDQLWAEAAQEQTRGVSTVLPVALRPFASKAQEDARINDIWVDVIMSYLGDLEGKISTLDVVKLVGVQHKYIPHNESRRLTDAMLVCGWERKTVRISGVPTYSFIKGPRPWRELYVLLDPIDHSVRVSQEDPNFNYDDPLDVPY